MSVQLNESNYLLWKLQIETVVKGYGLEDQIYGARMIPSKFFRDSKEKLVANQEYLSYQRLVRTIW